MKKIRIPIIFHPPTWEEYTAEEIASEVLMNAFSACKIDIPEMTDSLAESIEWLEMFERDVVSFRKKCKITFEGDYYPDRPLVTGTLILHIN